MSASIIELVNATQTVCASVNTIVNKAEEISAMASAIDNALAELRSGADDAGLFCDENDDRILSLVESIKKNTESLDDITTNIRFATADILARMDTINDDAEELEEIVREEDEKDLEDPLKEIDDELDAELNDVEA